jgi:hypothetical protein
MEPLNPGLKGQLLKVAHSSKGAWRLAATGSLQTALSNFNRRMRKPHVWWCGREQGRNPLPRPDQRRINCLQAL